MATITLVLPPEYEVFKGHFEAAIHDIALGMLQIHRNPEDPMNEDAGDNFAILKRFMSKADFIARRDAVLVEFKKVLK